MGLTSSTTHEQARGRDTGTGTDLHEDVSGSDVSSLPHRKTTRALEHVHFAQVGRTIHVYEAGDVLVCEVAEERNLAQDAFRERDLLQRAGHHLDRDRLSGYLVRRRAEGMERSVQGAGRTEIRLRRHTYITNPYAPDPSSRMSFHRFST